MLSSGMSESNTLRESCVNYAFSTIMVPGSHKPELKLAEYREAVSND